MLMFVCNVENTLKYHVWLSKYSHFTAFLIVLQKKNIYLLKIYNLEIQDKVFPIAN